jgi:hypothetical protein
MLMNYTNASASEANTAHFKALTGMFLGIYITIAIWSFFMFDQQLCNPKILMAFSICDFCYGVTYLVIGMIISDRVMSNVKKS